MKKISVPSRRWHENEEFELTFPDRWEVDNLTSPGLEKPRLSFEQIKECIENPIEGPGIKELARGKKQAVIVFDDMTRPTPFKDVARIIVDNLHAAGMKNEQIRFIWALGCHGTYSMIEARKKLGDEIVENYAVYNHDAFQNTVYAGRTPTGVELYFNREFMACDLKIGLGGITSHPHVGFGGGAKIILPGVAAVETVNQFHNQQLRDYSRTGLGNFDNNIMRAECDAAGDIAGLNFKVDCLVNRKGEITSLFGGPFRAVHSKGAEEAKEHFGITYSGSYDIAVCNSYAKANESAIAITFAIGLLKPGGTGTGVLISNSPEGQVPHYAFRIWGSDYGGRQYTPRGKNFIPLLMKQLFVMNPAPDKTFLDLICHIEDATVVKTWPEILALLEKEYPGKASVCVVQDGTMQYLKQPCL